METMNTPEKRPKIQNNSGRVIGGIVILMVGLAFFARRADLDLPYWLFSWPMILVVIGIFIGSREGFRPGGWLAVTAVGMVFLADDILDTFDLEIGRFFWPSVVIAIGLYMIFKPRRFKSDKDWDSSVVSDDVINSTAIFGGSKVSVLSKNFKGGEVSTMFGGTDIVLTQADFQGTAVIHMSTAFGGVKIVAPAHWHIKSEVVCIFGGIDDKRPQAMEGQDSNKTLVLKGTCIFGGLDIKSH
jgi:predicted membrane protein